VNFGPFNLRDVIGMLLVLAFVGAFPVLFYKAIPEPNRDLITYMLGQLSGLVSGVVGYHYVMSKALDAKHERQADGEPTGAPGDPVHVVEETR
jgi:hypothetical protein